MPPVAAEDDSSMINEAFSGGPAGLLYGFILVWAGTAAVFASLSQLASMYVQVHMIELLLIFVGRLPLEASIIGSSCSRHILHESSSAMSQAGSNHFDQVLQALIM